MIPGFADHVAMMNKTNMNFGAKQDLEESDSLEDDPTTNNGSSTTANKKKKHKVKRFESSKFTNSDMFDPDHGPSEISERINEEEPSQKDPYQQFQPEFQDTFGDSSFAGRDDISQSDATNKYYQSYVRKFDKNHAASKGIGGIHVQSFSKNPNPNELAIK